RRGNRPGCLGPDRAAVAPPRGSYPAAPSRRATVCRHAEPPHPPPSAAPSHGRTTRLTSRPTCAWIIHKSGLEPPALQASTASVPKNAPTGLQSFDEAAALVHQPERPFQVLVQPAATRFREVGIIADRIEDSLQQFMGLVGLAEQQQGGTHLGGK